MKPAVSHLTTCAKRYLSCCLYAALCLALPHTLCAGNSNEREFVFGIGVAGLDDATSYGGVGIEYRHIDWHRNLRPIMGYSLAGNGLNYLYAGFRYYFHLSRNWRLGPTLAAGVYNDHRKIDLGGDLEFRSGIELGRNVADRLWFSAGITHLSNAGIYETNPGTETISFSLCFGF